MNIGVSTASLYPKATEEALEIIGKNGVKTTEIFFNAESELKPSFVDIKKQNRLLKNAQTHGI
jgi:sugar phosphate isomerase/epimerase